MIKLKLVSNTVRGLSLSKKPRNLSENWDMSAAVSWFCINCLL
ncbi:hypothetical protein EJK50_1673 [Moraxella catarrhalis]|nr:hypothetical protein EJK50_1673 [Moraxella catarrhalis]